MHTVELLEQALDLAERFGYKVWQEWLDGSCGGGCQLRGRKVLFLDLALGPGDQLDQVLDTLRRERGVLGLPMAGPLRELLRCRKSA